MRHPYSLCKTWQGHYHKGKIQATFSYEQRRKKTNKILADVVSKYMKKMVCHNSLDVFEEY